VRESFDLIEYLGYLRSHWRFIAIAAAAAVLIAGGVSLLMPKQYTATVRILIEPPGGSDQRVAVAVSPIYLESLRSYEHFATSDNLFIRAMVQFDLRQSGSIESLKRRLLKVEVPRSTRVLEIRATLPDAAKAHKLALFIAQETVKLSRSVSAEGDRELIRGTQAEYDDARAQLDRATSAWNRAASAEPLEGLSEEIKEIQTMRTELERDASFAQLLIVENAKRAKLSTRPGEVDSIRTETQLTETRLSGMRKRIADLDHEIAAKQLAFSRRAARREVLTSERKSAEAAFAAVENRLREIRGTSGFRSEQLNIVDPGITPERPSSPNVPLNVIAALLVGLTASVGFLSLEFSFGKLRPARAPLRVAG
jgi:uncharacterized protein involved in exopolysaccharide biosynthesis